jgi:hypothetical protein
MANGIRLRFISSFVTACLFNARTATHAQEAQKPTTDHGPLYRLVNRTDKFTDAQCFWSLNGGKDWHSFAEDPRVLCPRGNGRLYFRLGPAPKNLDDRESYWDFIEYASENSEAWHGNTTQVDAFCIPITIAMGDNRVGITESRKALFEQFRRQAPAPFKSCLHGDWWILSPCRADFRADGPNAHYFDTYINDAWAMYARERKSPSGKWIGRVVDGALTFTPVGEGKPVSCASKPTTQDVFMGTGVLAVNPQFCAAINRHVLADPADWRNASAFYKAEPCNWYAKFFHEHSVRNLAYGFCYDDVAEQAAFFSGTGKDIVITLTWDSGK